MKYLANLTEKQLAFVAAANVSARIRYEAIGEFADACSLLWVGCAEGDGGPPSGYCHNEPFGIYPTCGGPEPYCIDHAPNDTPMTADEVHDVLYG